MKLCYNFHCGDEFVAFLMNEDYKNRKKLLENFNRQIEKNQSDGSVVIASGLADRRMYERKKELKIRF